jgi:cytoskeletal protein CcmA (bactofilin family)
MFSSKPSSSSSKSAAKTAPAVLSLSVIGVGMIVRGDVETTGVVKVEGTVDGHVTAKSQVLVAKGGVVKGDIETREAVVGGLVAGAIHASERVEIQSGASVEGDVTTRRIAVAEGASLNGQIRMGEQPAERIQPRPQRQLPSSIPTISRPSVPIARVAVSPRAPTVGS